MIVMIDIIYKDAFCVVVSKPNNVLVHHAPHSRNKSDEASLLQLLAQQTGEKYYPIHRLDRKTSGILLLASDTKHVSRFQELFTHHRIQKTYYGIVRGHAPVSKIINSPVKGRDASVYKEAETHIQRLETVTLNIPVKPYDTSRYSLIKLEPKTGRLHQLRIHMNKISHPLVNDAKYGDKNHDIMYEQNFGWTHLFLHAGSLKFVHPFTDKEMYVQAPFPEDWLALFDEFDWKNPIQ